MAEPSQLPPPSGSGREPGDGPPGSGREPGDGRAGSGLAEPGEGQTGCGLAQRGDGQTGSGRRPGGRGVGASHPTLAALIALAAVIAGTALLGAATGFLWAALAPRALAVVAGRGSASVVNPETNAFIAADAWFTLLTAAGGIISRLLGYALAGRPHGALALAGVLAGGLAATLIALRVRQHSGAAAFNRTLAIGRPGTLLRLPLMLAGHGPLAFWPLTAGLTAGSIEMIALLTARRNRPAPLHAYAPPRQGRAVPPTGP